MSRIGNLNIEKQDQIAESGDYDNLSSPEPSQDQIEQAPQMPYPSEEAILRFLEWLEIRKNKEK